MINYLDKKLTFQLVRWKVSCIKTLKFRILYDESFTYNYAKRSVTILLLLIFLLLLIIFCNYDVSLL